MIFYYSASSGGGGSLVKWGPEFQTDKPVSIMMSFMFLKPERFVGKKDHRFYQLLMTRRGNTL